MNRTRREFAKLFGAAALAPLAPPIRGSAMPGLSLWERADLEEQETGEVSAEVTRALLDNQGSRSVFDDEKEFEELRKALARKVRDHRVIRHFEVPTEAEPILTFEA